MSVRSPADATVLPKSLARLQELTAALDQVRDIQAREAARGLAELLLDLHGLALARATAIVAAAGGPELMGKLIDDEYVRAVLLLHGLHPQDAATRLREAIERMRPHWVERGFDVALLGSDAAYAHVCVCKTGNGEPAEDLRLEVEAVLVESAPDLEEIRIEITGLPAAGAAVLAA